MRSPSLHLLAAVVTIICAGRPACSQDGQLAVLNINALGATEHPLAVYTAELETLRDHRTLRSSEFPQDGTLRFGSVPFADYRLTIVDGGGTLVYQRLITVSQLTSTIMVALSKQEILRPPSGSVAMRQLQHPPGRKAIQAVVAAQKSYDAGDYALAGAQLRKVIQISPNYAQAHSDLAVLLIRMGLSEQAMAEIRHSVEIAGPNAGSLSIMALAQYYLELYSDAMQSARRALLLDPDYNPAHYLLGVLLARDSRTATQALPHLERAARTIADARLNLLALQKALRHDSK